MRGVQALREKPALAIYDGTERIGFVLRHNQNCQAKYIIHVDGSDRKSFNNFADVKAALASS